MQFLTQTILIKQVRTNIAIIRARVNQNRNNLIAKLTIHLYDRWLMIYLFFIQWYIKTWNYLKKIPNSMCLLCTIYIRSTNLILQTIYPVMIFASSPRLLRLPTCFIVLFSWSEYLSYIWCIKLLRWCNILLVTYILRPCSLSIPFSFVLCITSLVWLRLSFALQLFIALP